MVGHFQLFVVSRVSILVERHDQIDSTASPTSPATDASKAHPHAEMIAHPLGVLSYPRSQAAQKLRKAIVVAIMLVANSTPHRIHLFFRSIIFHAQRWSSLSER